MLGDHSPDIKLGSVIYGRVSGYPWWPAVVTKCPNTHQWTKGGKFWVFFFNDTTGAWLKASQIRSFDRYNHDLCHEHNASVAKFRRYQERISKAVSIAENHVSHSAKPVRIKVLPPKRSSLPAEGSRSDTPSVEPGTGGQRDPTRVLRKPPLTSKREHSISGNPLLTRQLSAENENFTVVENAGTGASRPKRKRMRSIRYLEQDDVPESKAPQRLHGQSASKQSCPVVVSTDTVKQHITKEHGDDHQDVPTGKTNQARRRSSRLRLSADAPCTSSPTKKRSQRSRVRSNPLDSWREKLEANVKTSNPESSASAGSVHHGEKLERDEAACLPNHQSRSKITQLKGADETIGANDFLTKHLYVTELKEVAKKPIGDVSWPTSRIRTIRGVRSLVGIQHTPVLDANARDDYTDSEERPERERKVNNGSLEVAAEDLVEHAIQGYRSNSSDPDDIVPEGRSIAFSNDDLVSSILNRLSNLEKDVSRLNKRAASEEHATLGEDATAAGVKSAVEALAAASAAFARARDYNVTVIRRSMEVLWPDGQFPLVGADGDLLRTVAQSLILASCKRRRAEIEKVANEMHDVDARGHETEKGSLSAQFLVPADGTTSTCDEAS